MKLKKYVFSAVKHVYQVGQTNIHTNNTIPTYIYIQIHTCTHHTSNGPI